MRLGRRRLLILITRRAQVPSPHLDRAWSAEKRCPWRPVSESAKGRVRLRESHDAACLLEERRFLVAERNELLLLRRWRLLLGPFDDTLFLLRRFGFGFGFGLGLAFILHRTNATRSRAVPRLTNYVETLAAGALRLAGLAALEDGAAAALPSGILLSDEAGGISSSSSESAFFFLSLRFGLALSAPAGAEVEITIKSVRTPLTGFDRRAVRHVLLVWLRLKILIVRLSNAAFL
jgi:hypothetical protein